MKTPEFKSYYSTTSMMNEEQLTFYKFFRKKISDGEYVDVEGNISYVFVFLNELIQKWNDNGYETLSEFLVYISELYHHEDKVSFYCNYWANDCLLGLGKYDEYIERTEPIVAFGTKTHESNLRLNIQLELGIEANPLDVLLMVGGRKSKFIEENHAIYKECVKNVFGKYSEDNGGWFKIYGDLIDGKKYKHYLFSGAPIFQKPTLRFDTQSFYTAAQNISIVKQLSKDAENMARKEQGVPQIGEGWISETSLYRKIESEFNNTLVIQHGQPRWLGKQHFDIWIPDWKIAIEYHGRQHYEPVKFFGGDESFEKTQERDKKKINLAKSHGVKLIIVNENDDQINLIDHIRETIKYRKIKIKA